MQSFNAGAKVLKSLGFYFDGTKVQTQIDACREVYLNYMPILNTGVGSDSVADSVDNIVAKLKNDLNAAGANTVIAEEQRQYNAFLAAK